MSRRDQHRSSPYASPSDLQPEEFEALVRMHQRYPEDVVTRASRGALKEGRRRSQLSDMSGMTPFPSINPSPTQADLGATSAASSPSVVFQQLHRFSAASTSSTYSGFSTAGESGPSASYLAPPGAGRLLRQPSETTVEGLSGRDDSSNHSESEDPLRTRRGDTAKNYVCTYCNKDFGGKSDWKRHETTFHEPQYSWLCPICNRSFNSKRKFSTHHARDHNCDGCDHLNEAQKALPGKTAFGCGFQSCDQVLHSWDERCNHVAKHFEDGEIKQNWHYSTMIRNLLRQEQLDGPWQTLLAELHGHPDHCPALVWRQEDTRALREALEYERFGHIPDLLRRLYHAGRADGTSSSGLSGMNSPAPLHAARPGIGHHYGEGEELDSHGQLVSDCTGHTHMGPDLYSDLHPVMQSGMRYYQAQTTPPSEVVPATAYGMPAGAHAQMYQQLPYASPAGFQGQYHLEHPQPYPPVPSNSFLASDAFYPQGPYAEPHHTPLPPQAQAQAQRAPPREGTESPQVRQRADSSRQGRGRGTPGVPR